MDNRGGRYTLQINGVTYSGRGKATIKPAGAMRESGVNQDSTGYSTVKPVLRSIGLTFDRGSGIIWDESLLLADANLTFNEVDLKRPTQHLMTGATITGTPEIDTETGEVSGLTIEGSNYQAVAS